jgi:hypothetical protein
MLCRVQGGRWGSRRMLQEGGAYGHMSNVTDDLNLTFGDFKQIIKKGLQGKLENVSEKLDGQNLMVSWKNGKLLVARNKGHIKNKGATALGVKGVKDMFAGRGEIETAFHSAAKDLQNSIKGLSDAQQKKIFNEGEFWMNLEVIYPATTNVIPYGLNLIVFHGTLQYDDDGNVVGEGKGSARTLAGMIQQINQHNQKTFSIAGPQMLTQTKSKDFSARQSYYLSKLNKLQSKYGLSDKHQVGEYYKSWWVDYIKKHTPKGFTVPRKVTNGLLKRWVFNDKSYGIRQAKLDILGAPKKLKKGEKPKKNVPAEKFYQWVEKTDKQDKKNLAEKIVEPFDHLFMEFGSEILTNVSDILAVSPDASAQSIKKELETAISELEKSKDHKVQSTLQRHLKRIKAAGGIQKLVPSEGIVFAHKGKVFKFTSTFAPANQLLGLFKFG